MCFSEALAVFEFFWYISLNLSSWVNDGFLQGLMHRECVVLPNVKLRSAGEIPANLVYNSKILDTDNCYTIPSVLHQTLNLCSHTWIPYLVLTAFAYQHSWHKAVPDIHTADHSCWRKPFVIRWIHTRECCRTWNSFFEADGEMPLVIVLTGVEYASFIPLIQNLSALSKPMDDEC